MEVADIFGQRMHLGGSDCPATESGGREEGKQLLWVGFVCPLSLTFCVIPHVFQVVAMYPFVARSSHEVSLQAGQRVTVLEAQDKKGNPEWSLVEVNGQRGYVPSSFLARAPSPAPWGWSLPS